MVPFNGEYQPLKIIGVSLALALTVSEILAFTICDHENIVQGHEVTSIRVTIEHVFASAHRFS